ncbi:isopenicillin N synthase family dioxygenase [Ilumatobacter sp.]|uniref:isopenicillin N synthase family dioxygenase n=1 Tax=Ilumatobacter sp. TaxID=1967498 RepID=UPI003B51C11D
MTLQTFDLAPFATGRELPSPDARRIADDIDDTLRSTGFLLVTGHGVDDELRESYFDAMRAFFALPTEDKDAIAIGRSDCHRGYVGMATETLEGALAGDEDTVGAQLAGDLKETLDTGVEQGPDHPEVVAGTPLHGPNQWPDLPGFRDAVEAYRAAVIEAARRMQRALAMALDLDPGYFEDRPGETMFHLRLIHYPPMETLTPEPGQLGCGAHTDYGTLTLLADDGNGGLQVRERSGEWTDVVVPDGHLVVNLGDLMAIWTNDRWVSNPHRVVNPPGVDRYSSPLFVTPPFHLRIEALETCLPDGEAPRHDPMTSGPYLLSRFDGTHAYRNELLEAHNRTG